MAISFKKKPGSFVGQLDLFPDARHPTAKEFAKRLFGGSLVSKRVLRKRAVQGKPKSINVLREIESAYSFLEGRQGVNIKEFVKFLESTPKIEVDNVLRNERIFVQLKRSGEEQAQIKKAVEVIARFVNRKKRLDALRKMHAGTPKDYAERSRVQRHLKGIAGK